MSRLSDAELVRLRQRAEGAAFYDAFGGGVPGEEFPPSTVLALLDHIAALSEERNNAQRVATHYQRQIKAIHVEQEETA